MGNWGHVCHFLCTGLGEMCGTPGVFSKTSGFPIDRRERTLVILKGPSLLAVNLGLTMFLLRFLASSHTLSPVMKGVNFD